MIRLGSFARAVGRFVADGCTTVTAEQYHERLAICQLCPRRNVLLCGKCRCVIIVKAGMRSEVCPDKPPRWPSLDVATGDPPTVS